MKSKKDKIERRRLRSAYITTVISISMVLFILGVMGLLILNARKISDYVKENIGFFIYIEDDAREVEVRELQKVLDAAHFVKSTKYVTKEEAAGELQESLGEDFVSFLGYNPLTAMIRVTLNARYANADSLRAIESYLKEYKQIKEFSYEKNLVQLVNKNVKKISKSMEKINNILKKKHLVKPGALAFYFFRIY